VNYPDAPQRLLVDPIVLATLRAELDDDEGWRLFLECFLAQLPLRIQKLRVGLLAADHPVAMDAVLSLKVSSQMVGAERLAGMAIHLQRFLSDMVDRGNAASALPELAGPDLDAITACAQQTLLSLSGRARQKSPDHPAPLGT
jgi:HPt (histidine-containing phosphotransfer) domain-containing protein